MFRLKQKTKQKREEKVEEEMQESDQEEWQSVREHNKKVDDGYERPKVVYAG